MPVTLGEVIAAPCGANAESGEESSGMVPTLDVPVRLGPKIFPCSYDGEIRWRWLDELFRLGTWEREDECGDFLTEALEWFIPFCAITRATATPMLI